MENKIALIIGNSEYQDATLAQLSAPSEDVNDLAAALAAPEIGAFAQVQTLVNESAPTVMRAIARFFAQKKPDDLLLLYFSGHGVRDDQGHLYLAVKDTEHDLLSGTAIPSSFITGEMDRSRSRRQVLILDCCHSGAFAQGSKGTPGESVGTATAFEGTGYGRIVLTATDATQYAWQDDQVIGNAENSVFTHYLIEGLKTGNADIGGDGQITVDELYDYVYGQVVNKTPKQTPGKWSYKQQGEIVIAQNPHPVVKPAALPPDVQQTIEDSRPWVREGGVHELERLLQSSQRNVVIAAIDALRKLAEDDSRRVASAASAVLGAYQAQSADVVKLKEQVVVTDLEKQKTEQERLAREQANRERQAQLKLDAERRVIQASQAQSIPSSKTKINRMAIGAGLGILGLAIIITICALASFAQSLIPSLTSTQTPKAEVIATQPKSVIVSTPLPTGASSSTQPTVSILQPGAPSSTPTLTPSPASTVTPTLTPTGTPAYNPPVPFDPPNGRIFAARSTILRWTTDRELKNDELFEVSVWPESSNDRTVIGTTHEKIFPIEFGAWKYGGMLGKFFWSVRIKRGDNALLSNSSQTFSFTLTEAAPPAPPVPTAYKPF